MIGALTHFGRDNIGAAEKKEMRNLILRGGPWSREEQTAILEYCASDVYALKRLLPALLPKINNFGQALQRGRYMAAAAAMEYHGVPINVRQLKRLRENWEPIRSRLRSRIDPHHEIYDETGSFRFELFESWLSRNRIPWPVLESGRLATDDDTFREMAKAFPLVAPIRELKHTLSEMRLNDLAVGSDERNRCMLSAFRCQDRTKHPIQYAVHFRAECLVAESDPAFAWLRPRLRRLVAAGNRDRRRPFRRSGNVGGLPKRGFLYGPGETGRVPHLQMRLEKATVPCGNALNPAASESNMAWSISHLLSESDARKFTPGIYSSSAGRFFARFGLGAIMWWITRSSTDSSRPFSDGGSGFLPVTIRVPYETFTCRPMVPKCCGWPVVSRLKRGSKSSRQSTMRWFS